MSQEVLPFGEEDGPLVRAWRRFHAENPHVYELFKKYALEAAQTGRTRFGARMIWNRMRWYVKVETTEGQRGSFKLNNNHTPYYARLFMRDFPHHAGLFETRRSQAEEEAF